MGQFELPYYNLEVKHLLGRGSIKKVGGLETIFNPFSPVKLQDVKIFGIISNIFENKE